MADDHAHPTLSAGVQKSGPGLRELLNDPGWIQDRHRLGFASWADHDAAKRLDGAARITGAK